MELLRLDEPTKTPIFYDDLERSGGRIAVITPELLPRVLPRAFLDQAVSAKLLKSGEPCWVRTSDLLIKSQLLYRLS